MSRNRVLVYVWNIQRQIEGRLAFSEALIEASVAFECHESELQVTLYGPNLPESGVVAWGTGTTGLTIKIREGLDGIISFREVHRVEVTLLRD